MDAAQLQIVRAETAAQNIHNIDYRVADVTNPPSDLGNFDLIYTRFLLSHLSAQFLLQIGLDVVFYGADGEAKHHLDK